MKLKRHNKILLIISLCFCYVSESKLSAQSWSSGDWTQFHDQAVEESLVPVRPGEPNKSPFWNPYSRRFIHVPSFDFKSVDNASKYLFTAISDISYKHYTFEADSPWSLLTPIWEDLPVGIVYLKVEGLNQSNEIIGLAGERMFYRAAVFNGPYKKREMNYATSATLNFESLFSLDHYQNWLKEKSPSPDYFLYCYPSKIIGSVVQSMILYSKYSPENKNDALAIAINAANYLINIRQPKDAIYEFFPPTYSIHKNGANVANERIDQIMMFYPAYVGSVFLDLYETVKEEMYLDAAIKIAETYQKHQLPSGTWYLTSNMKSGEAISANMCVPIDIISFLDRLIKDYGIKELLKTRSNAFNWMMENQMKTFHWEGQFEDMGFSKSYSNMERGKPLAFARILFEQSQENPQYIEMAEELLRFAEDQFVVWENPLPRELFRTPENPIPTPSHNPSNWMTPSALEQYDFYTPIDASAASAILAFIKAYKVTGKKLYLAKAISLADAQTYAQNFGSGIYPTFQRNLGKNGVKQLNDWNGWINCATITGIALLELDKTLQILDAK